MSLIIIVSSLFRIVDCCIIILLSYCCHIIVVVVIVILSSTYLHRCIIIFSSSSSLYCRIVVLLSYCCHIIIVVSSSCPDLENPAKIMACGTRMPVVVWRIRTAAPTFFAYAALFFGMLAIALYSVEMTLSSILQWKCNPSWVASRNLYLLDESSVIYGAISDGKMTSDDDSHKEWCDRHIELYTQINFIGPSDIVNTSIIVLYYIVGT